MTATEDAISSQMVGAVDHLRERKNGSHSSVLHLEFTAENL